MEITSKYSGQCKRCKREISAGDTVNWIRGIKGVTCTRDDCTPRSVDEPLQIVTLAPEQLKVLAVMIADEIVSRGKNVPGLLNAPVPNSTN